MQSPLTAGIGMLPMLGAYAVVSFVIGSLGSRVAPRLLIVSGMACLALGPLLLSRFTGDGGYGALGVGLFAIGLGLGLFQPSSTTEAVKADDLGRKGLVSGLVYMFQFVGGAIGLGLTTSVVTSTERAAVDSQLGAGDIVLTAAERTVLDRLLAGSESVSQVLQQFDAEVARQVLAASSEAFAAGFRSGMRLDAGIAAVGVVLAVVLVRSARVTPGTGPALHGADQDARPNRPDARQ